MRVSGDAPHAHSSLRILPSNPSATLNQALEQDPAQGKRSGGLAAAASIAAAAQARL